ncbi:MAG: preprotein translocase subunit SecA [Verrucomicrobiales bacterium]|jgi:preprotein translocase subunit SecA|nr:preprotein translocase subunit SecA [Verrucomicrobiales bacterium]
MLQWFISKVIGSRNQRVVKSLLPLVARINQFEQQYQSLSDEQLQAKTVEFRQRLANGETLDNLLPEAFAAVKNCCRRFTNAKREIIVRGQPIIWEMIPFDVQLIGGIALHQGKISEMATGEGKTLVATLPTYLNALTAKGVHVVTVNDYLAARDSEWMGEVYRYLGLTVGCLQNGQNPDERRVQYAADIAYGTNSEFGFDYLRDNGLATRVEDQVQRGHPYAIIDEVDSILIDEARTPLIISGPATVSTHQYDKFKPAVASLVRKQHSFLSEEANRGKELMEAGKVAEGAHLLFKVKMGMPRNKILLKAMEEPATRRAIDDAELALYQDSRKTELYKLKEELYFTIEEKSSEADLSEMGREFLNPNEPDAFVMPDLITINHDIDHDPNLSPEQKAKAKQDAQLKYDDASQRIHNISQLLRAYCVFEKDVHYVVQENKVVIVDEYTGRIMPGRRWSDGLHQAVEAKEGVQIDRETQTLATITIQNYFRLYDKLAGMTGTAETEANEFRDIYKLDLLVIPANRPCLRKDADDLIFKTRREKLAALVDEIKQRHAKGQPLLVGTASVESSEILSRMLRRDNIPHNVLNAKYHQQEAEIVARAGQRGSVTIATNMAGRGTDIKLGPGVAELGGLHVIGTERHESRRIDRQLRGRCSRQGDPGSSQFFISFEDDLMRNFGDSRRISAMMTRLGMEEGEGLSHPWLNKTVENAQKRVEQRNYQIRKHTLQYDDVLNQQRNVIYTYRTDILTTENIREEVFEVVNDTIEQEVKTSLEGGEPDVDGLLKWLNSAMPLGIARDDINWTLPVEQIIALIKDRVHQAYETKIRFENPDAVKSIERYIILNAIDRLWQEHLYAIDSLKTAIGLRAHGQKDPLIEYKQEGYTMFAELMANIKKEIVNNLFRSSSSLTAFEQFLQALPQKFLRPDVDASGMSGLLAALQNQAPQAQAANSEAPAEKPADEIHLPIRRNETKYGRNDMVIIRRGNETQTVKYKKAEPMLVSGWTIVGKADEK